jgi:hypothetical protein
MTWELLVTAKSKAAQIKALARRHTQAAIKVLAAIMNQADGPATARVSAAQALLDRGWGKATQPIAGEEGGPAVIARIERVIVDPQENNDQDSSGEANGAHS